MGVSSCLPPPAAVHVMLGTFWFPPLHRMGVMEKGTASIVQGWQLLKRAACAATAKVAAA